MKLIPTYNLYIPDKDLDKVVIAESSTICRTEILGLIRTAFELGIQVGQKNEMQETQGQEGHLIYDVQFG